MGVLEVLILAVGLSMDAFAVSVCKGLAMGKIRLKNACIVGLWFGGFQALMPLIGYLLGSRFQVYIEAVDHWVADPSLPHRSEYDQRGSVWRRMRGVRLLRQGRRYDSPRLCHKH